MADMMAIISKAVFEKAAPGAAPGQSLTLDRYGSTHKSLESLGEGGDLYLVTVRPPDERLWLAAVLVSPERRSDGWYANNAAPIVDITWLKPLLKFQNGTGLPTKIGALGMSLQTPRLLAAADVAALGKARGGKGSAKAPPATVTKTPPGTEGDGAALLLSALEAWRAQPVAELADAIDKLSAMITAQLAPFADETAWSRASAAKRPEDVGRLLAGFTSLPTSTIKPRMEKLAELPTDPRISAAVAAWVLEPPTTSSSNFAMWTTAFKVLCTAGDRRAIPILEKRLKVKAGASQFWPRHYAAIERTLAVLRKTTAPQQVDADAALIDAIAAIVKSSTVELVAQPAPKAAAPPSGPPLDRALGHLQRGQLGEAVEALLESWRVRRLPQLGDLIERISDGMWVGKAPPTGKPKDLHADWLARYQRDAVGELPLLLAALPDGTAGDVERRVRDLSELPDDPRVARRVADVSFSSISPERTGLWRSVFDLVARTGDLGAFQLAHERYPDLTREPHDYDRWRQAKRALAPLGPERLVGLLPTAAESTKLTALAEAATVAIDAAAREERGLLAAVLADPKADEPRLLYGDWLLDRGHVWGELLQLQIRQKDPKRVEELIRTARRAGLGVLNDLFDGVRFERGFPVEARFEYWLSARAIKRSVSSPLWPFFDDLTFGTFDRDMVPELAQLTPLLNPKARARFKPPRA